MSEHRIPTVDLATVELERDGFLLSLLRELSGTLQDVIGIDEASGFISVVGQKIGENIDLQYRSALQVEHLSSQQVGEVLVDLKRRIHGTFRVVEQTEDRIVLSNDNCPFGDMVIDRPALCMMTSNVFGVITAENLGYARVVIDEAIAYGDAGCHVVVHLKPTVAADETTGREYFKS